MGAQGLERPEHLVRSRAAAFFGQSLGGHDADGWLGGVQAGCDYQFAGGVVIGIQGDYAWTDAKGSNVNLVAPFITDQTRVKSLATVTGRIGYAWERFLGYVKGGGAWERDEYAITTATSVDAAAETRRGWTIGVGGEYAFTNSLSGFAEYNYYDFGSRDLTFTTTPARQLHRQHQGNQERRARRPQRPVRRLGSSSACQIAGTVWFTGGPLTREPGNAGARARSCAGCRAAPGRAYAGPNDISPSEDRRRVSAWQIVSARSSLPCWRSRSASSSCWRGSRAG